MEKPFAIMVRRVEDVERFCTLDQLSKKQLLSRGRPIVLLPRKRRGRCSQWSSAAQSFLGRFFALHSAASPAVLQRENSMRW